MTDLIRALSAAVDCRVLVPTDAEYDVVRRVWNADIDRRPSAIVRCEKSADAASALRFCVERGVPLTVRGGGHNLAGTAVADGAVMIDLQLLKSVVIDQAAGTVTVGAGCAWGDVDRPASEFDLAVPAGVVSHTGVAGLTLGGGFGYLSGLFGTTADHLVEAEVVVGSGELLRVNHQQHPDLFWALKGAGHNYGIVTEFTFRTVPLPGPATVRQALYPAAARKEVLQAFRHFVENVAPRNLTTYVRLLRCPPYWSQVPAEHRAQPMVSVATVHYGDPADEPAASAAMFADGRHFHESVRTMPHVTLQHATDDEFRYGLGHYWRHTFLDEISDKAIDVALEWVDRYPGRSLNSSAHIAHQLLCPFEIIGMSELEISEDNSIGGGITRYSSNLGADWEYPSEKPALVDWVRQFDDAMTPFQRGTYINFTSVQGDDDLARAVYGDKHERLVSVKHRYDPDNVFQRGLVDLATDDAG